jgi:predicted nucleic acid-binding protein
VRIVIDTDVASTLLKGRLGADERRFLASHDVLITFVTAAELRLWSELDPSRRPVVEPWLSDKRPLFPNDGAVGVWARIRAAARRRGRPMSENDAWIAAICVAKELPLLTFNRRDFAGVRGLLLVDVPSSTPPRILEMPRIRRAGPGVHS